MPNKFAPYDPFKHGVTQGLLTTFMRCRQEAKNQIEGLEPIRTSSALQFGSMAHRLLEIVYRTQKKLPTPQFILQQLENVRKEFLREEGGRLSGEGMENLEVNCAILTAVLPQYFLYNSKDFASSKWVELEEKFQVESPFPGIKLVGRIDGAYNEKKEFWLFESKTKSRIEEDTLSDALAFDFQTNTYQYALFKKYGRRANGVLYNILRRPGQRLKKDEKLPAYSARILEEIKADPAHFFIRFEMATPRTELARFESELFQILKEFVAWFKGELFTYRNTSACQQKYGPCKFLPRCANGETSLYRQRTVMFPELVD